MNGKTLGYSILSTMSFIYFMFSIHVSLSHGLTRITVQHTDSYLGSVTRPSKPSPTSTPSPLSSSPTNKVSKSELITANTNVLVVDNSYTCGVTTRDSARCWRGNGYDQLGARVTNYPLTLINVESSALHLPLLVQGKLSIVTPTVTPTATVPLLNDPSEMVFIPAGEFEMGCDSGDPECNYDETPLHRVYLDDYYIDRYEVTNARYTKCVEVGACKAPSNDSSTRISYFDNPDYANFPVVWMRWEQADTFCHWEEKRLPTEAEWEKAARGQVDARKYTWGDDPFLQGNRTDCQYLNYYFTGPNRIPGGPWDPAFACVGDTVRIGSYGLSESPYGAMDMLGNVWEWTSDWYAEDYYSQSPVTNPPGPASGDGHVIRGGSWYNGSRYSRVAHRSVQPNQAFDFDFGFRCARSP